MISKTLHKTRHFFRKYIFYYKILGFVQNINSMMNPNSENLKEYYSESRIFLPKDSKWRQYRFWLSNGRCIKIKAQIRDELTLRKYLLKYSPIFVTYSASAFLNPIHFGPASNEKSKMDQNIFLYNDIIFDVDSTDLNKAQNNALLVIDFMRRKGYEPESIIFSGSKGFHIKYNDYKKYDDPYPSVREKMCADERKLLVNELTSFMEKNNLGNYVDSEVTRNTRGFVRVPGTINCKTGYACWPITENDLKKPVAKMLAEIPKVNETPKSLNTDTVEPKAIMKLRMTLDREQGILGQENNAFFISSRVNTSESVIFLRYKGKLMPEVIEEVRTLQRKYLLGNFYLFRTEIKDEYYVICPEIVSNDKFKKIIKSSGCMHRKILEQYPEVFLRMSRKKYTDGKKSLPVEFLRTIKSNHSHNQMSDAHCKLLGDFKISRSILKKNKYRPCTLLVYHDKIINGEIIDKKIVPYNSKMII